MRNFKDHIGKSATSHPLICSNVLKIQTHKFLISAKKGVNKQIIILYNQNFIYLIISKIHNTRDKYGKKVGLWKPHLSINFAIGSLMFLNYEGRVPSPTEHGIMKIN